MDSTLPPIKKQQGVSETPPEVAKPVNSVLPKLVRVMASVTSVAKSRVNPEFHYKYVPEAEVVLAVREALIEQQLFILPSLINQYDRMVERTTKQGEVYQTPIKGCTILYTIHDAETGDSLEFTWAGEAGGYDDKGLYKAFAGCNKYALMKLLQIPQEDDPEAEATQEVKKTATKPGASLENAADWDGKQEVHFGKHKGKPWSLVPEDDLKFYLKELESPKIKGFAMAELLRRQVSQDEFAG